MTQGGDEETGEHYTTPESRAAGRQKRALGVLQGGKGVERLPANRSTGPDDDEKY